MTTRILKFGGTSVSDGDAVRRVAAIVAADEAPRKVVVVSAQGGVTATLLRALGDPSAVDHAVERWRGLADELDLGAGGVDAYADELRLDLQRVLPREEKADLVASYGERVSAVLVTAFFYRTGLRAAAVDARDVVVTDGNFGSARPDAAATAARAKEVLLPLLGAGEIPVVTGFIGADRLGRTTTLGRGGSDLTATLLGACLAADAVEIWTDADGVMSADPRIIPEAKLITRLSYDEAVELSSFGAKVVFNKSLPPAIRAGLPVHVRNTFNPASPGTIIAADEAAASFAVTTKSHVRVVTITTPEMIGAVGFLARLFEIFESFSLSVDVVAVSEASVSVTVNDSDGEREAELMAALQGLGEAEVKPNRSIVAVISKYLDDEQAIFAEIFGALTEHGVDIEMISYGNREINLTLIVDGVRESETLRLVHELFADNFRR